MTRKRPTNSTHPLARRNLTAKSGQRFEASGVQYTLRGVVGNGAVGVVRRAERVLDGGEVAVKLLAPDPAYIEESSFDDVASRFRREGERGAKLARPHLLAIEAYEENADGAAFEAGAPSNPMLIMEFVRGSTLESVILKTPSAERGQFRVTQPRLHAAIQVAMALDELQRVRVVHRDVKPANIFVSRSRPEAGLPFVTLGDFGVTKWGDFQRSVATGTLTATMQKGLGTLKYMSPEQALQPKNVSVRSDEFSLGITLYELFTGQILPSAHHVFEVMSARMQRGTAAARMLLLNHRIDGEDSDLAEMILEMHLRGASGRPTIDRIKGRLAWEYEARFGSNWEDDIVPPA